MVARHAVQLMLITIISYKPLSDLNFVRYTGQYLSYIVPLPLLGLEACSFPIFIVASTIIIKKIMCIQTDIILMTYSYFIYNSEMLSCMDSLQSLQLYIAYSRLVDNIKGTNLRSDIINKMDFVICNSYPLCDVKVM